MPGRSVTAPRLNLNPNNSEGLGNQHFERAKAEAKDTLKVEFIESNPTVTWRLNKGESRTPGYVKKYSSQVKGENYDTR